MGVFKISGELTDKDILLIPFSIVDIFVANEKTDFKIDDVTKQKLILSVHLRVPQTLAGNGQISPC